MIIMADDLTYNALPVYGGSNVDTPHIDRLAKQGMTFNKAFTSTSMCNPVRASLQTGLYPVRNGVCWNHAPARNKVESAFHYLRQAGYRAGLAGKVHIRPRKVFNYEKVPGVEGGAVSPTSTFDPTGIRNFVTRDKDQPFYLTVAFTSPHVPWTVGDAEQFDPQSLDLPPYLADTRQTREDYARYLAEIVRLDQKVGRLLSMLKDTGQTDNTLVLFTSEQGGQFPGAKWTNWNLGVHTAVIVRWPDQVETGTRTDALVQYVDILPTLLDAAGENVESYELDGRSFLPVLAGQRSTHRDYAYFMHNNVPEGPPYAIRGITDGQFHYLRNYHSEKTYIEKHLFGKPSHNPYLQTWFFQADRNQKAYKLLNRFMHRPAEELYNLEKDPFELSNLAETGQHQQVKQRLIDALDQWMQRQGDPGPEIDTWAALRNARKNNHFQPER
jgi:uncharacterized sulfatase